MVSAIWVIPRRVGSEPHSQSPRWRQRQVIPRVVPRETGSAEAFELVDAFVHKVLVSLPCLGFVPASLISIHAFALAVRRQDSACG